MTGYKHALCVLLLTVVSGTAIAQNNTNSPYTRYGYGQLSDQYFANSKAMGGVAYGLRNGLHINPSNPASYTAVDSLTFLVEGGVSLQNMNISEGGLRVNAKNSSFDYLAMQFRLNRRIAMSIGLLPYSNAGYSFSDTGTATNGETYLRTFSGSGGFHQVYAGLGVKLLKDLSVGVNLSYFWGDIDRSRSVSYPNSSTISAYEQTTTLSVTDYKLDLGAQYTARFGKDKSLTLGLAFSPERRLHNDLAVVTTASTQSTNNLEATVGLPATYGLGLAYNYAGRLTIGADYKLEQWSKADFAAATDVYEDFAAVYDLADRSRVSLGAEFLPELYARSFLKRIRYRAGIYYSTPYYKVSGKKAAREYGISAGFGLPIPHSRSILNISGQYVRVKGLESGFASESIFRVNIGLTFNDLWFFKRKVE